MSVNGLFRAVFRAMRGEIEKRCAEKVCFNRMTPEEDAFEIHFGRREERRPLFRLKVVSEGGSTDIYEEPKEEFVKY